MKVELRPIVDITPYEGNPRQNDGAVDAVAASIREFGFRQPIVVDDEGVIVVGHTRWKAAQRLDLEKAPVHVATDLTPEQAKAYRIADNQTNTLAAWDFDLLPVELAELQAVSFDLDKLGFSPEELQRLLAPAPTEGLTDPDEIPSPPDEPTTKPGDLIILGEHRLLCGDSASETDVDRLLDGAAIHLVNSDPPYNVNVEPRSNNAILAGKTSFPQAVSSKMHVQAFDRARLGTPRRTSEKLRAKDRVLENDYMSPEAFAEKLRAWFGNMARVLQPGRAFYIWGGYANWSNYCSVLSEAGLYFSQGITWVKSHPVLGRKDFMNDCEHCWYGWREGTAHQFLGPNNATNVWAVKKVSPQAMVHLTEKPVELATRAIQYSSRPGENVLDLFGGSGSTLIGCEQTGQRAFLMEIDPAYCDVIVQRWEEFTGRKAERPKTAPSRKRGKRTGSRRNAKQT